MRSRDPFTTSIAVTDPSRRIVNLTSAISAAEARRGVQFSVSCRTTFCRYPGYGKSIPRILRLATSAPVDPCAPAPAFGGDGGVFVDREGALVPAFFVRVGDGVAFGDGTTGLALAGRGTPLDSGTRSAPPISGAGAEAGAGSGGVTTPACRGPGGAPTSSTRYTGGRGVEARAPHQSAATTNATCTTVDSTMPSPRGDDLAAEGDGVTAYRPAPPPAPRP